MALDIMSIIADRHHIDRFGLLCLVSAAIHKREKAAKNKNRQSGQNFYDAGINKFTAHDCRLYQKEYNSVYPLIPPFLKGEGKIQELFFHRHNKE
jgi:hypothetical protein